MLRANLQFDPTRSAEILDFDGALFERCSPELRDDLTTEAAMLIQAFAPDGRLDEIAEMARVLSAGDRDAEFGRARARLLAAALKRLAKDPSATWRLLGRCG